MNTAHLSPDVVRLPLTLFADRLSCERRIILSHLLNRGHKLQSADIWVCWPAKPRYRSFNTNMLTEVYYD